MSLTLEQTCLRLDTDYPHILEFGVASGDTLSTIVKSIPQLKYKVFAFDSFQGLPEDWVGTDLKRGFFNLNGQIPNRVKQISEANNVKIYAGWFEDTINEYLKIADNIALLHIDCDLYSSTKTVLYNLINYIKPGTYIVFDEWFYNFKDIDENRQHEQKCFYEWVKDYNIKYELIPAIELERQCIKILSIN